MKYFIFILILIVSCKEITQNSLKKNNSDNNIESNDTIYNINSTLNNFDERIILKKIIEETKLNNNKIPDFSNQNINFNKLDTLPTVPFDSIYYYNSLKYIDVQNDSLNTDDYSISNFGEYGNISSELLTNYKKKWYKVGLYNLDDNYKGLLLKYYDLITSRYILFVVNKDYKISSSICLFGYFTFLENTCKDEMVGKPYLTSENLNNTYTINVVGSYNRIIYKFKYENGFFTLIYNRIYNEDDTNFIYEKKVYEINEKDRYVNLRNEKSISSKILRPLKNGEKVTLYYCNRSKWKKVKTNNNEVGYIFLK